METRKGRAHSLGVGPSGMHGVEHHPGCAESSRPLLVEHHLSPLGPRIGLDAIEAVRVRHDRDDSMSRPEEYMPPEVTVMTRPCDASSKASSRAVSRNGATTWVCAVSSSPSRVRSYWCVSVPALCTTTSRRSQDSLISSAARRTPSSRARSATTTRRSPFTVSPSMMARASSVRRRSRPSNTTSAPIAARPRAVANPSPDDTPVTSATCPRSDPVGRSPPPKRHRRAAKPRRLKLPTTVSSDRGVSHLSGDRAHRPQRWGVHMAPPAYPCAQRRDDRRSHGVRRQHGRRCAETEGRETAPSSGLPSGSSAAS